MMTIRVARCRSIFAAKSGPQASEISSVLTWVLSVGGPIALADKASWELICSECYQEVWDGHTWYRTHPDQLALDLEDDTREDISRALRYLSERGLLMAHHDNPSMVRPVPELEVML